MDFYTARLEVKPNNGSTTHVKVHAYYSLGGLNYISGSTSPRGLYLGVMPIEMKVYPSGTQMESFMAFSGYRKLLEGIGRKSKSKEIAWAKQIADQINSKYGLAWDMVQDVCKEKSLTLVN